MKMCTTTSASLLTLTYSWYYFSTLPLGWLLQPFNNLKDGVFLLKIGQSLPLFVYFRLFHMTQLIKALMVCMGLQPGAAGLKAQTKPLSYGGIL